MTIYSYDRMTVLSGGRVNETMSCPECAAVRVRVCWLQAETRLLYSYGEDECCDRTGAYARAVQ